MPALPATNAAIMQLKLSLLRRRADGRLCGPEEVEEEAESALQRWEAVRELGAASFG
jgi:hypothetical protein